MDTDTLHAVFALAGVALGGGVSTLSQLVLHLRQRKAAKEDQLRDAYVHWAAALDAVFDTCVRAAYGRDAAFGELPSLHAMLQASSYRVRVLELDRSKRGIVKAIENQLPGWRDTAEWQVFRAEVRGAASIQSWMVDHPLPYAQDLEDLLEGGRKNIAAIRTRHEKRRAEQAALLTNRVDPLGPPTPLEPALAEGPSLPPKSSDTPSVTPSTSGTLAPLPAKQLETSATSKATFWTVGPAWLGALLGLATLFISSMNLYETRTEKRLHVDPRVLWDVATFTQGSDWKFSAENRGGVDVEGYDLEFEAVSFPVNRGALNAQVTAEFTGRWGKRIGRGEAFPITLPWTADARALLERCPRATGNNTEGAGPCVLGVRVTEVFHRSADYRTFYQSHVFVPMDGSFHIVGEVALTNESIAVQRFFSETKSELLGRVPIADGNAHAD